MKPGIGKRILVFLLILAAVLGVTSATVVNFDRLRRAVEYGGLGGGRAEAYEYGEDKTNSVAAFDGGLAVASENGLRLFTKDGAESYGEVYGMDNPVVTVSGGVGAVWDVGAASVRVFSGKGIVADLSGELPVIDVAFNAKGWLAVTSREEDYKGAVSVYDSRYHFAFKWYSSSNYILGAAVSPDCKSMAAVTLGQDDALFAGHVVVYGLDSEEPKGGYTLDGELLLAVTYLADGEICAVGEDRAVFLDGSANQVGEYDYGGRALEGCSFGGKGFAALALGRGGTSGGALALLDGEGKVRARLETGEEARDVSACGDYVAALYGDELVIYTGSLDEYARSAGLAGVERAQMMDDGTVLLIGSGSARLFVP